MTNLDQISQWINSNKLTINLNKSKFKLVGPSVIADNQMLTFVLKIQNQNLERVKEYKYLGVIFDEKLNWKAHISHLTNRLSEVAGIFYKLKKIMNKNTLIQVYYALVHSHLICGILSWGRACKSAIRPLCVIVNRIINAVCLSYGRYDAVSPLYQKLQVLKIPQLYSTEL